METKAKHDETAERYRRWALNAVEAAESLLGDLCVQGDEEAARTCADAVKRLQDAASDFGMAAHHARMGNSPPFISEHGHDD